MVVEAKPPVRRSSSVVGVLLVVGAVVLVVPVVLIGGALLFSILFVREATYVPPAQPVVYSYSSPASSYDSGMMAGTSPYSPDFQARLSAAQQIQDSAQRDQAFGVIAARLSGNAYEAGQALQQIQDMDRRDAASWDAAKRFSEQSQASEALTLVNNMSDTKTRDAAFGAIATGQWPERPGAPQADSTEEAKPIDPSDATTETALEASSS